MIKSNELRVGNWMYNKVSKRYVEFDEVYLIGYLTSDENTKQRIEPIELTEEILLSIEGVKQLNEYQYQYKFNDWFIIERYTTKEKWSVIKVISEDSSILLCFIDFLHELQNITFALTNKELEINI